MFSPTSVGSGTFDQFLVMLELFSDPKKVKKAAEEMRDMLREIEEARIELVKKQTDLAGFQDTIGESDERVAKEKAKLAQEKEQFEEFLTEQRAVLVRELDERRKNSELEAQATRRQAEAE